MVISSSSCPVLASAERLAHIHDEVLSLGAITLFDSAKAALAEKWPDGPAVPELSKDHVVSCCIHTLGRKKIACVSFEADGVKITLAVVEAASVKVPSSETLTIGGVTYHVASQKGGRRLRQAAGRAEVVRDPAVTT